MYFLCQATLRIGSSGRLQHPQVQAGRAGPSPCLGTSAASFAALPRKQDPDGGAGLGPLVFLCGTADTGWGGRCP